MAQRYEICLRIFAVFILPLSTRNLLNTLYFLCLQMALGAINSETLLGRYVLTLLSVGLKFKGWLLFLYFFHLWFGFSMYDKIHQGTERKRAWYGGYGCYQICSFALETWSPECYFCLEKFFKSSWNAFSGPLPASLVCNFSLPNSSLPLYSITYIYPYCHYVFTYYKISGQEYGEMKVVNNYTIPYIEDRSSHYVWKYAYLINGWILENWYLFSRIYWWSGGCSGAGSCEGCRCIQL